MASYCDSFYTDCSYVHDYSIWKMSDGTLIHICDMTDRHLNNTINMLIENMDTYTRDNRMVAHEYIKYMTDELRRRKEMGKVKNVDLRVAGVSFANKDGRKRQDIIKAMTEQSTVMLVREPQNEYDKNAIAIMTIDGQVGYIDKNNAMVMAQMMDAGEHFEAKVLEVGEYKNTWYCKIRINQL